jgi:hypothetical protein
MDCTQVQVACKDSSQVSDIQSPSARSPCAPVSRETPKPTPEWGLYHQYSHGYGGFRGLWLRLAVLSVQIEGQDPRQIEPPTLPDATPMRGGGYPDHNKHTS